jgi:hypothetical protein
LRDARASVFLSKREIGTEHRQSAFRFFARRLVLQHIPMFGEQAIFHAYKVGCDPVSGTSMIARLEAELVLDAMVARFKTIEIIEKPVRRLNNTLHSLQSLSVRVTVQ